MASKSKKHRYKKKQKNKPRQTMASKADKYKLYEQSVQCVEAEIDFVDETFEALRGRKPQSLREDFCGTANTSCEWIRRRDDNVAISVDLDPAVLQWGRENKIANLTAEQQKRIELCNANVLDVETDSVDVVLSMNFSYWIFQQRKTMIDYFKRVHAALKDDGIYFLDAFGGYEAFQEMKEATNYKKFSYIWDQHSYNPITGECVCKIHFKFKDGSKMKDAFTYTWRIWTMPEIREMLEEAGFKSTVYWEGADEDGEGDGNFQPTEVGDADAGWIAYIVAEKQ